jgi:hypothetical protein
VAAGDQEVAAEGGHGIRFDAEGVDGVDADQHPAPLVAVAVVVGHGRADLGQGQLHPGAGVDPGEGEDAGPGAEPAADGGDQPVGGHGRRVPVEGDPPRAGAGPLGP